MPSQLTLQQNESKLQMLVTHGSQPTVRWTPETHLSCTQVTEHAPAVHTPEPLHALPSGSGMCATPVAESQASAVHALLSFTMGGVPERHVPAPLHVSSPLQRSPSAQAVPADWIVPGWQVPSPSQISRPLHALPSSHVVPAATAVLRQNATAVPLPTQLLAVQALLSLHGGGTSGTWAANVSWPNTELCGPMLMVLAHTAPVMSSCLPVASLPVTSRCATIRFLSPSVTAPPTSSRMSDDRIGLIDCADGWIAEPVPVVTPPEIRITT